MSETNNVETCEDNYPESISEGKDYKYNFWKNKPVTKFDNVYTKSENIEKRLSDRSVYNQDEPIKLPNSMKWIHVDLNNETTMESIAKFLKLHYLTDPSNKFKLDYTAEFIKWILGSDGILLAIVSVKSGAICGTVAASYNNIRVFDQTQKFGVVNFLCAHPIYRKKKIAFTLIDEITRRIVKSGVNQGCFTSERCVPSPTTTLRFYHRFLNYLKLSKYKFTEMEGGIPEKHHEKFLIKGEVPKQYKKIKLDYIPGVLKAFNSFMVKFNIHCEYTEKELANLLINKFVECYVELDNDDNVIDFVSYYKLPYIINGEDEKLYAGYLFLYSCNVTAGDEMMSNLLKLLSHNDMLDLFTVLDTMVMHDTLLIKHLPLECDSDVDSYQKPYQHKFTRGSGKIHFNFFNWKCPTVTPRQIQWIAF